MYYIMLILSVSCWLERLQCPFQHLFLSIQLIPLRRPLFILHVGLQRHPTIDSKSSKLHLGWTRRSDEFRSDAAVESSSSK